jgi:hypothetical protein
MILSLFPKLTRSLTSLPGVSSYVFETPTQGITRYPPRGGLAHHHIDHPFRLFLLRKNAVQTEEHGGYIPTMYAVLFQRANRAQPGGLC